MSQSNEQAVCSVLSTSNDRLYWTSLESGSYPVWFRRDPIRNYPENVNRAIIQDLGEQSLFIYHKNRNHFETCHDI